MYNLEIKDIHCHLMEPHSLVLEKDFVSPSIENAEGILDIQKMCNLSALNIPSISLYDEQDLVCNPLSLYTKYLAQSKGKNIFALAGIRRYLEKKDNIDMVKQAKKLLACGFDGFKMICKPNVRKKLIFGIDDSIFDSFYYEAEKQQWPILFHVGDPREFWNMEKIPNWALENNWYYGNDERIPSYEKLYEEVKLVLDRHPNLNITFAHFLFLSDNLEELSRWMKCYPGMKLDVTPGTEMYRNFSKNPMETKKFFETFQGRIIFGTDTVSSPKIMNDKTIEDAKRKICEMRYFFESKEVGELLGVPVKGIGLSRNACKMLYSEAFDIFLGRKEAKKVNVQEAICLTKEYLGFLEKEKGEQTEKVLRELLLLWGENK